MMRKMMYIGFSYLTGLFFASFFAFSVLQCSYIIIGILLITLVYTILYKAKKAFIIAIAIGFSTALLSNVMYTKLVVEKIMQYNEKTAHFSGEILDINYLVGDKAIYKLKGKLNNTQKVTIHIYAEAIQCDYYDEISFDGNFIEIHDTLSFQSKQYYNTKGIFLEASNIKNLEIIKTNNSSLMRSVLHYRDYMYNRIITILPNEEGAFLAAMLCGDKTTLSDSTNILLYRVGIGHILSVSGTHLMIISGLILLLLKKLKLNKWWRFGITETVVLAFSIFAGLAPSVIRSAIMFTILMLGTITKRRADTMNSLGIAGVILTIFTPFAILDASFLLSMAGTFGIGVVAPNLNKMLEFKGKLAWLKASITAMICVTVTTFPFVLLFFDEISIISPIANIILLPFCSVALICSVLVAFFGGVSILAYPLLTISGVCCKIIFGIANFLVEIPFSYIPLGYKFLSLAVFFCIVGIIIIVFMFKSKKALLLSVFSSIIILLIATSSYQISTKNDVKIAILTQNNSTAMIIYKANTATIIDLGGKGKISTVVQRFLSKKGIREIPLLILNEDSQKSISFYKSNLTLKPKHIAFLDNGSIFYPEDNLEVITIGEIIKLSEYSIQIINEGEFLISYGSFKLLAMKNLDENINTATSITFNYSAGEKEILFDNNAITINNTNPELGDVFLITGQADGKFDIRRLYYGLRE